MRQTHAIIHETRNVTRSKMSDNEARL